MHIHLLLWSGFRITWKQPCVTYHRKDKKHPLPFFTTAPLYKRLSNDSQTSFLPCSEGELSSTGIRLKAWMSWSLLRYFYNFFIWTNWFSSLGTTKIAFQHSLSNQDKRINHRIDFLHKSRNNEWVSSPNHCVVLGRCKVNSMKYEKCFGINKKKTKCRTFLHRSLEATLYTTRFQRENKRKILKVKFFYGVQRKYFK